jgi:hypothetical protein
MIERGALTRMAAAGAVAVAMAAACSSSSQGTPGESGGVDSGLPGTSDASTSGHDDAATSDATSDTGSSSSSSGGGSLDSGQAGHDAASDAAETDAARTPDAGAKDGAADAGGKDGAADGGATALATACAALCKGQSSLSCSMDLADCQSNCLAQAGDTENPAVDCETQYTAMAECEAKLRANQWVCSETNVVPIPVQGQCMTTLCAWSCCVGSDFADPDIWGVCMPQCP